MTGRPAALDEDAIARNALRFLKGYYAQRQRTGNTELSSNVRGAGGIVADGFLRYQLLNGQDFIATVEATSKDSREEVLFQVQQPLLRMDAVATASITTAAVFAFGFFRDSWTVDHVGLVGCLLLIILTFAVAFFGFILLRRRARRYHYIYAVEQFKQYYANEQWVALSEEVFNLPLDQSGDVMVYTKRNLSKQDQQWLKEIKTEERYYNELLEQCIYNGIGLILVRRDAPPVVKVTPSREDLFANKRRRIDLIAQEELNRLVDSSRYTDWLKKSNVEDLLRYQRQYKYQIALCVLSLLLIGTIFWQELKQDEINYPDREDYIAEMQEVAARNARSRATTFYRLDTPYVWPRPYREGIEGYALVMGLEEIEVGEARDIRRPVERGGLFLTYLDILEELTIYDCSRLYNLPGRGYIVEEGVYTYAELTERIRLLEQYGFECSGLALSCFEGLEQGYALYIGPIYTDEAQARRTQRQLEKMLGDNVLSLRFTIRNLKQKDR